MFHVKSSALASLFFLLPSTCLASHCPGNVASVHARHLAGSLIVVPVEVNHNGPYDFMVDTGSQVTLLDPRLAAELHLKAEGTSGIEGVGFQTTTAYTHLDLIGIGLHTIATPVVFVQDIGRLLTLDPRIRGVLGGNILHQFDILLDQDKKLLCLDTEGIMQASIRGQRIPLATPPAGDGSGADTEPLIVEVHLSRLADRALYLLIDSGAIAPYLCNSPRGSAPSNGGRVMHISGANGPDAKTQGQDIVVLPQQDLRIGSSIIRQVSFVTASHSTAKLQVDGLLPTGLFRRVYIDYDHRFVVLESW